MPAIFDFDNQESWPFEMRERQSPIAIHTDEILVDPSLGAMSLNYGGQARNVTDTGTGIQGELSGQAFINHRIWDLLQFHIHAPAEHTIDGKRYAAELHLVHRRLAGSLAVVAVFFEIGEENSAFTNFMDHLDDGQAFAFNLLDLIPDDLAYYHYLGSLTTPPLSENVEWYILPKTLTLSQAQLDRFHAIYPRNNRDLQPIVGRVVVKPG